MFRSSKKSSKNEKSLPADPCVKWMLEKEATKFKRLCLMHLSFILDLHGADFETLTDEFILGGNHKESNLFKAWTKKIRREISKEETCLESKTIQNIEILISFLNQEKNFVEGLFRKTGNLNRQKALKHHLNSLPFIPNFKPVSHLSPSSSKKAFFSNDPNLSSSSPHDLANLLKSLFRSLGTPVITSNNHIAIFQISELKSQASQLECMQLIFQLLDHTQMKLLTSLLQLLHSTSSSSRTLMDSSALATIFLPIILLPPNMKGEELVPRLPRLTQLLTLMINKHHLISHLPSNLLSDARQYYEHHKNETGGMSGRKNSESSAEDSTRKKERKVKRKSDERNEGLWGILAKKSCPLSDDDVDDVRTTITFADQKASLQAGLHTNTTKALGQLYAYVECLPANSKEGSLIRKRRQENHKKVVEASVRSSRTKQHFKNKNKTNKMDEDKNNLDTSYNGSFNSAAINLVNNKYDKAHKKHSDTHSSPLGDATNNNNKQNRKNNHNNKEIRAKVYKENEESIENSLPPLKRLVSKVHVVDCSDGMFRDVCIDWHADDVGDVV